MGIATYVVRAIAVQCGFAALVGGFTGCEDAAHFDCGEPINATSSVIRKCDKPDEICVCATRSCARPVALTIAQQGAAPTDASATTEGSMESAPCDQSCETGYCYYDDDQFGPNGWKGKCVPVEHMGTNQKVIRGGDNDLACGKLAPDSSNGASGNGGAGGSAGSSSGGNAGTSGVGGSAGESDASGDGADSTAADSTIVDVGEDSNNEGGE